MESSVQTNQASSPTSGMSLPSSYRAHGSVPLGTAQSGGTKGRNSISERRRASSGTSSLRGEGPVPHRHSHAVVSLTTRLPSGMVNPPHHMERPAPSSSHATTYR